MYTYRKQIQVSQGILPLSSAVVNTLDLTGLANNKIADVEIKATLFDSNNSTSSIIYYRNVQIIDPAAAPGYTFQKDSSFNFTESTILSAYLLGNAVYNQGTSTIIITAFNSNVAPANVLCIIDYKINFY